MLILSPELSDPDAMMLDGRTRALANTKMRRSLEGTHSEFELRLAAGERGNRRNHSAASRGRHRPGEPGDDPSSVPGLVARPSRDRDADRPAPPEPEHAPHPCPASDRSSTERPPG